jgi:hypothetical protein
MVITHGYAARLQTDAASVTMEDSSSRVRICGGTGDQQRRICAVIGHATSFWTRRSLCADQGLLDQEAVQVMTAAVLAITAVPIPSRHSIAVRSPATDPQKRLAAGSSLIHTVPGKAARCAYCPDMGSHILKWQTGIRDWAAILRSLPSRSSRWVTGDQPRPSASVSQNAIS